MTQDTYRRLYGMTLGAALGLAFGLTSQALNSLAIPDVIFHQPPLGLGANILMCVLVGGLIGLVSCWLSSSLISVLIAAVLGGIGAGVDRHILRDLHVSRRSGNCVVHAADFTAADDGLNGGSFRVLRWIVNQQVEQRRDHVSLLAAQPAADGGHRDPGCHRRDRLVSGGRAAAH